MMKHLVGLWMVLACSSCVSSGTQFIEVTAGGAVTLPCAVRQDAAQPSAVRLLRTWLRPGRFFFQYTNMDFTSADYRRVSASGDPSTRAVNVTISELSVRDTDRYTCEFVVTNLSEVRDDLLPGVEDFFLLVSADSPASDDVEWVDVCAGDSVGIPCVGPRGAVVEGVTLKRQRGRSAVELLYHSQQLHGAPSDALLPPDRVRQSSALGPQGPTYNLTLLQMQPEDSGRYSCQLVRQGQSDSASQLGRKVVFVSVQGGVCSCSGYTTLLYIVCSAVIVLVLLLGSLFVCHVKVRRRQPSHPPPAIYEEMVGVQLPGRKQRGVEEVEGCEYRNFSVKSPRLENHYEMPSGAPKPKE